MGSKNCFDFLGEREKQNQARLQVGTKYGERKSMPDVAERHNHGFNCTV